MTTFFRFPHTPHLSWLGEGQPRADKILSPTEREEMLSHNLVVEEKIDGANLGFSLASNGDLLIQNRGKYLFPPFVGQFTKLSEWLSLHEGRLFDLLDENLIVFGEWCTARHSLAYTKLPDWWLLFDIYDKRTDYFLNTKRRNLWAKKANLHTVHQITQGYFSFSGLESLLINTSSHYRQGSLEGLVLRKEDDFNLTQRAKLVQPKFTQAIEKHWSRRAIQWNQRIYPSY